jgi:type VI secretion system protein ImpH
VASPIRQENPDLKPSLDVKLAGVRAELYRDPHGFDFFQAVRLLELLEKQRAPVGAFARPREEAVQFRANASLAFPASAIQQLTPGEGSAAPAMTVNFMGLTGPQGILPEYYTELVIDRLRAHDPTVRDFFDIFNHRALSLFYRAWERSRFTIGYEREGADPVTTILRDAVGLGEPALFDRQLVRDQSVLFYAGLYASAPHSATGLELILSDYFNAPFEIEQFVGVWRSLEEPDQCCFDAGDPDSTRLGFGAVAGDEIWDRHSRARIRIGPLSAARYRDFLPDGCAWQPLGALVRFYCGYDVEFETQLVLDRNEVPACVLGGEDSEPRLGWLTWMKSKPEFDRNPGDTVLLFPEK